VAGWLPDVELGGDELDDQGLWEAAVAASPTLVDRGRPAIAIAGRAIRNTDPTPIAACPSGIVRRWRPQIWPRGFWGSRPRRWPREST
jgi:hypothetical protein